MGSRVKENPVKLFEVFVEVAKPEPGQDAFILQKYPLQYDDEEVLKTIPRFVYPCEMDCSNVDHFTFVLTDQDSQYRFGFCRHATGAQTCLCVISFLPWFEVFYKLLNMVAELLNRTDDNSLTPLLENTFNHEIPMPGVPVTILAQQEMFSFTSPDLSQLPNIPSSRNLTEYYNAIDTNNMMVIFASMLNERRLLFTSKKLSRLTACIHGAESLLYPMHWQYLFIPVLPAHLIDYASAPMPYVIGVHATLMGKLRPSELGDAVIVDADKNTVQTEYSDLEDLPEEVLSYLKKYLKGERVKSSMLESGDAISRAFLNALVRLIGGYRDALKFHTGEPITFEPEAFVTSRATPSMQAFLQQMLQLQIFQQFINGRLEILNCGEGFNDLFEKEAVLHADKLNTQSKYKEWASNMKRQGKKFHKSGKEVLSDVRERAPIMMNSAVQSMKHQGKKAVSGIKARLNEINESTKSSKGLRVGSQRTPDRQRPATIIGPTIKGSRPPRPPQISAANLRSRTLDRPTTTYKVLDVPEDDSTTDDDLMSTYQRVSCSLLSDPDIQQAYQRSPTSELCGEPASDDSSAETPSSGSQTPAEESGIPYIGLDSGPVPNATDDTQAELSSLPRSSPVIRRANGAPSMAIQGPPPIPAPRSKSSKISGPRPPPRPSKPKPNDEQLIRFESTESEPEIVFDPFAVSNTQSPASQATLADDSFNSSPGFDRSRPNRSSLINRSPAFRKTGQETPVRNCYKPDNSPENSEAEDPKLLFDPLAGFNKSLDPALSSLSKPTSPKSPSLLQDWSFSQLASSPMVSPPPRPQQSSMSNPAYNMTMPQSMRNQPPPIAAKLGQPTVCSSPLYKDPRVSNPLYVGMTTNSSSQAVSPPPPPKKDPFGDIGDLNNLVRLSIGPQITKPTNSQQTEAQKSGTWETFD
ncbi:DENN domain-containing protein 1B-like isoform X2 [Haliotis rubra]|uniref:DENN domain-containing protein 1B-like isoform X2 n=1 Tax=Haliotis rubra TaxID=36100 RepID=UPI001EE5E49F|nr:DENN domain-containing protein 1B-like isoform X2 [Haliotis rubra]